MLPIVTRITHRANVHPRHPVKVTIVTSRRTVATDPVSTTAMTLLDVLTKCSVALFSVLGVSVPYALINMLTNTVCSVQMNGRLGSSPMCRTHLGSNRLSNTGCYATRITGPNGTLASMLLFLNTAINVILFNSVSDLHPSFRASRKMIIVRVTRVVRILVLSMTTLVLLLANADKVGTTGDSIFGTNVRTMITVFNVT